MMISELSPRDLRRQLRRGLTFHTPPYITRVKSSIRCFAEDFQWMYADYEVLSDNDVPDFYIRIDGTGGFRRFFRRQCMAYIDINTPFIPLPENLSPLMLEQALNWSVATRTGTYLVFHAAIVARDGKALLMPGASGQGKSTLCASLVAEGWQLYSDELTLLDMKTGSVQAYPRPVSLKNQSIDAIQAVAKDWRFSQRYQETPKGTISYMLPTREQLDLADRPAKPVAIISPRYAPDASASWELVQPSDTFLQLIMSSINYNGFGEQSFDFMFNLMETLPMGAVHYNTVEDGVAMVEEFVAQL